MVTLLPLRWEKIRGDFRKRLDKRLRGELEQVYAGIPAEVADALMQERRQALAVLAEITEVRTWLNQREEAASVAGMYGK
jgi:hypothetical protein